MNARASFVVLLALVAGCSNLEDLDRDRCGNGIVERGEDCDSSDARCVSCGIRCEAGACAYPGAEGFVCGADDFCHAPAGTFKTPSELSAAVETFRVTDVDHDGIGDLMVQSSTALQVFRGNADGAPTATSAILTPIARGAASYADLDGDQTLDLLLPTDDGIAAYTSTYGDPSPYPFPSDVGSIGDPMWSHAVGDNVMAFIGLLPNATTLALVVFDVTQPDSEKQVAPLCGATAGELERSNVEVFDLSITKIVNNKPVREAHQLVAVTLQPQLPALPRMCVLAIDDTGGGVYQITRVQLPPGLVPGSRPVLAPLRPGRCPSLVVRVGQEIREFPGADSGTLPCAFATPVPLSLDLLETPTPVGWMPLEPPLKTETGDVTHALVTVGGVFTVSGLTLEKLYQSDRPLAIARAVDIDDDGDIDLVASARDASGASVEDLDILYRTSSADPLVASRLLRYRYDTAGPVSFVELGDFDGNSLADVAFVQRRDREGTESTELAIAYATHDQLLPPLVVGSFPHVVSVVPAGIPDSNDPASLIDDLVVLYDDADAQPQVTLLHGSTQRVLNAYFDPRVPDPDGRIQGLFRAVVGGRFYSPAGMTAAGMDLLAFAAVDDASLAPGETRTVAWISDNASGGAVQPIGPVAVPAVVQCELGTDDTEETFCLQNTQLVTVPRGDASLDVVIGVDVRGHGLTVEPSTLIGGAGMIGSAWETLASKVPEPKVQRLRSLELVEVDSGPRLIASFAGGGRAVVVCVVDPATGVPSSCMDVAAEVSRSQGGAGYTCTDAALARVTPHARFATTPPPARELIALCREGSAPRATIFRLTEVAEGFAASPLLELDPAQELRTGDLNGDGIDDLVTVDHVGAIPTFRLYMQCTSRDSVGCGSTP